MKMINYKNFSEYTKQQPKEVQKILKELHEVIKKSAPKAEESISYGMPTFKYNGPLVYFAGQKHHLGFYPTPSGVAAFKKELADYSTSKGCIRFSYHKPLPVALIAKIVKFRVKENNESTTKKKVK